MDEKEFKRFIYALVNSLTIVTTLVAILINSSIIKMHRNQPLLKEGFFVVVQVQIITELIINISLFFLNIFYLIYADDGPAILVIFPIIFNFGYIANISYNIRIIYFLLTFNKDGDDLIQYRVSTDAKKDGEGDFSRQESILIVQPSFKNFHYFSFGIAFIHTVLYTLNILVFQNVEVQTEHWQWYLYFINGKEHWTRIFFFIPHLVFFIISSIYLFKSYKLDKISSHIYLRSFSLYAFVNSIISLLFLTLFLIFWLGYGNDVKALDPNYLVILILGFFGFLLASSIYRLKSYYVNYIANQEGKNCCSSMCNSFKILFGRKKMGLINFVDFNSLFIVHALSSSNDFLPDDSVSDNTDTELLNRESSS